MYFEFDPNFTSSITKKYRLQFDRGETGNKIKFLHILKPGGIVYAEKFNTQIKMKSLKFIFIAITLRTFASFCL